MINFTPLQFNGGPTQTHAVLPGYTSIINRGNNALIPPGSNTDQRGAGFARISGGTVDIGAFELQGQTSTWTGAGAEFLDGADVQVTAYGGGTAQCKVDGWGSESVGVHCFTPGGVPIDSQYTIFLAS